jgi:hypothetical protein
VKVRQVIAALTPRVNASQPFRATKGTMSIEREPSTADRLFEVRAADNPGEQKARFGETHFQVARSFVVSVRYDSKHHADALEGRIVTDDDQIRAALQLGANRATGVQSVRLAGGSTDVSGQFVIRSLTFEVLYFVSF